MIPDVDNKKQPPSSGVIFLLTVITALLKKKLQTDAAHMESHMNS